MVALLPIAIAATLAGTITQQLNALHAERRRKKMIAQQAEADRVHREKANKRLLRATEEATGESAKEKLDERRDQNLSSIVETRSRTARPIRQGAGSFKGRISNRTQENRASSNVATALREATRNKNLASFLAQGNHLTDLGEVVRRSGQDINTIQRDRAGEFDARSAGIAGVRPNVGIDILAKVLQGIGTATGLASAAPAAAGTAGTAGTVGTTNAALGTGTTGFANAVNPLATLGSALPVSIAPASVNTLGFTPAFLAALAQGTGNSRQGFAPIT